MKTVRKDTTVGTSYAEVSPEHTTRKKIRVQNPATNTAEILTLAVGAAASEVDIATIKVGETYLVDFNDNQDAVLLDRLSIKSDTASTPYFAEVIGF